MRIKGNGNVGIGTGVPANRLDVEGAAAIGSSYSGLNAAPTDGLIVQGRTGIGTATPHTHFALQVKGIGSSWEGGIPAGGEAASVVLGEVNGVATLGGHDATQTAWQNLSLNPVSGNVGIGTTAPTTKLDLPWNTVDGGGVVRSNGGAFELSGTIGQADAGRLSGGDFERTGGFWFEIPPGDCQDDGDVDLFDHGLFESCLTGPAEAVELDCRCFDINARGTVDLADFAKMSVSFTGQ